MLIIYLVLTSPSGSISLPILHLGEQPLEQNLFGLSARKVYHALLLTQEPVSSYLTFSPLPIWKIKREVCFLWHYLSPIHSWTGSFLLGSAALYAARTFLSDSCNDGIRAMSRLAMTQK